MPTRPRPLVRLRAILALLCLAALPLRPATADNAPPAPDISQAPVDMAGAAMNFYNALTPEQRQTATFGVDDPQRYDWHFIPRPRKGLAYKDMNSAQRDLAHALLSSGLSPRGFQKAVTIMSLDEVLKAMEQGKGPLRDPENYYWTLFGKPGPTETWGWRVEGHHLSLNFLIVEGKGVASTPAFMGANPAEVREGPRAGLRVMAVEEDLGRELVTSLDEAQRKAAIFSPTAPKEVVTGNARKAMLNEPVGVLASDLNPAQKQLLAKLLIEYATRLRRDLAERDLKRASDAGLDKIRFAWAGGIERGQPHYYRIQGPTFLVEYDDTQNNANHIHTVWRDLEGHDFGEDLLLKHYQDHPHDAPAKP